MVSGWRPRLPEHFLQVIRDDHGQPDVLMTGVVSRIRQSDGQAHLICESAPGCLLKSKPLPFPPPRAARSPDPAAFEFWWKQLTYAFELSDPALTPALPSVLSGDEVATVNRFIEVTRRLAQSEVVTSGGGMTMLPPTEGQPERVQTNFPRADAEAGFAVLLRQCSEPGEAASYRRVHNIVWRAAERTGDTRRNHRLEALREWFAALKVLRKKSVDQLVRDRLVRDEGATVFASQEAHSPMDLLHMYSYGDLIHWGDNRTILETTGSEFEAASLRFRFLGGAVGLAHGMIGYGEVIRAVTSQPGNLFLP